jgi:hypothetical protein
MVTISKFTKDNASSIFIFNKATILKKKHTYLIEVRMGLNGRLELMRVPFFSTTLKLKTMRNFKESKKLAFDRRLGCLGP